MEVKKIETINEDAGVARTSSVSRRQAIAGALAGGAVAAQAQGALAQTTQLSKKAFVLVPGAYHGGWCYARVAQILRQGGHDVFTPTLTGVGDKSHLLNASINLSMHIKDILNLIEWEQLENIVLCGHSYGGMVITGVATAVPTKIASIVYLDALLPDDNQSLIDMLPADYVKRQLDAAGRRDGFTISPTPAAAFNVNEKDRAWVDRLCTPQPFATFMEKIKSTAGLKSIKRKHYVYARNWGVIPANGDGGLFRWAYDKVKDDPTWTKEILDYGHDVMVDHPAHLAEILNKAAG